VEKRALIVAVIGNIANIAGQKWMEKDLVFMMLANGVKPINKGVVMKDKIDALREEVMMKRGGVWLWDDVDKAIAQAVAIAQEDKAALEEELEDVVKCGNHFQQEIVRLEQELAKARLGNACIYGTSHPEIYKCGHEQELDELKKKGSDRRW